MRLYIISGAQQEKIETKDTATCERVNDRTERSRRHLVGREGPIVANAITEGETAEKSRKELEQKDKFLSTLLCAFLSIVYSGWTIGWWIRHDGCMMIGPERIDAGITNSIYGLVSAEEDEM